MGADENLTPREACQTHSFVIYLCGPSPEGKYYVGQTTNFLRRCLSHQRATGECPIFHRAVTRYGFDAIGARIIAETNIAEEADRLERLYISQYNSLFPHGYNMTLGGRSTMFDKDARIANFTEAEVPHDDILFQANLRKTEAVCPVCGNLEPPWCNARCERCSIDRVFGNLALDHLCSGLPDNAFLLSEAPKVVRSFRSCPDVNLLLRARKQRLNVRTVAEAIPVAAAEYYARLAPYMRTSLKRDVLARKGLASFNLGKWAFMTSAEKTGLDAAISCERYIRTHKEDFFGSTLARIGAVTSMIRFYGYGRRRSSVLETAQLRGARTEELSEAILESEMAAEIEACFEREINSFPPPKSDHTPPIQLGKDGQLSVHLSLRPPDPATIAFYRQHCFSSDLYSVYWSGAPKLVISRFGDSTADELIFSDLPSRRAEIRRLLTFTPPERRLEVERLLAATNKVAHNT